MRKIYFLPSFREWNLEGFMSAHVIIVCVSDGSMVHSAQNIDVMSTAVDAQLSKVRNIVVVAAGNHLQRYFCLNIYHYFRSAWFRLCRNI